MKDIETIKFIEILKFIGIKGKDIEIRRLIEIKVKDKQIRRLIEIKVKDIVILKFYRDRYMKARRDKG